MTYLLREGEYTRLTQNQGYVRENMDSIFMLGAMDHLYQAQHVTYNVYQDFTEMNRTNEQAGTLLDLLISGTSYRYEAFCDFCKEEHPEMYERLFVSDYSAIADMVLDTAGDQVIGNDREVPIGSRCKSPPACLQNLDQLAPAMVVNVIPVVSSLILSKMVRTRTVYTPTFPVRGIALLFFNVEFTDRNFPRRSGTEHDLDNLSRLFHDLSYNVKVIRNASRNEVLKELESQRQNRAHRNLGSFILGFSTHWAGNSKAVACADGKSLYIHQIYQHFDSANCPFLAGKPKFVFFDTSAGCAMDRAVSIDSVLEPPKTFVPVKKQPADINFSLSNIQISSVKPLRVSQHDLVPLIFSSPSIDKPSCRVPDKSDFIIAMSTFDGYVSWRRNSHGCWFSRILVEVFQKHACDHELVELLKIVRRKMSYVQTSNRYKQVNMTIDTSLKQFYFFPGVSKP